MDPVEEGVRHLVRHHVVRQAREDARLRDDVGVARVGLEVSEEEGLAIGAVVRVRLAKRVRVDPQAAHEGRLGVLRALCVGLG